MQAPEYSSVPLEIGGQAVWSLSSSKPGFGITQLRDGSTNTYWQWALQEPEPTLYKGGFYWNTFTHAGRMGYNHTMWIYSSWKKPL